MDATWLDQLLSVEVASFMLVFMRVSGLVLFAPIFSSQLLPLTFRFYLVIALSFLLAGNVPAASMSGDSMIGLLMAMAAELAIGFILGSFVQFIFAALQLAGQTSGTQLGLALASVVNPQFDDQTSTTSVIYATVASLIFFATGLDREMIRVLLDTFGVIPLGEIFLRDSVLDFALSLLGHSMVFAVRVAAPVVVALFLAELALGFVGRTVPQLNVLSVGFSLRIILGLFVTMVSLSEVGEIFMSYVGDALVDAAEALAELVPDGL